MLESSLWNAIKSEKYFNFPFWSSCSPPASISIFWHQWVSPIYWNLISSRSNSTTSRSSFIRVSADSLLFIQCHYRLLRGAQYRAIVIAYRESGRRAKWNAEYLFILLQRTFFSFQSLALHVMSLCTIILKESIYIRYPWMHECDSLLLSLSSSTRIMKFLIQIPSR